MDTPKLIHGYPQLIYGHPPLIEFSSFLIKLEYHVNLSYLHLHQYATITRPYSTQPLTVKRRYGYLANSIRVNISTRHEPSAFKQNTGYTTRGRRRGRGRGCGRTRGRTREHRRERRRARRGSS